MNQPMVSVEFFVGATRLLIAQHGNRRVPQELMTKLAEAEQLYEASPKVEEQCPKSSSTSAPTAK